MRIIRGTHLSSAWASIPAFMFVLLIAWSTLCSHAHASDVTPPSHLTMRSALATSGKVSRTLLSDLGAKKPVEVGDVVEGCDASDKGEPESVCVIPIWVDLEFSGTCKLKHFRFPKIVLVPETKKSVKWKLSVRRGVAVFRQEKDGGIKIYDNVHKDVAGDVWKPSAATPSTVTKDIAVDAAGKLKASAYAIWVKYKDVGDAWQDCDEIDPIVINDGG